VIPLTLAEVASAVGGRLAGGADPGTGVTGPVVVDSRQAAPGALFVALPGERSDGHDHAPAAVAAGAVAVIAGRDVGVPAVLVDDPLAALGLLARSVVDRLPDLTVIGITGSSGKTSTKDLLAVLLADLGPTVAPAGSFNNEVGLPLTALRADASTRYLICEMGARRPGNIAYLCDITPPDVAVVLNVGLSHVGVFGGIEQTAATKGELPASLRPDGVAVLNVDDPRVRAMADRTVGRVVTVGLSEQAQVRAERVETDGAARASFRLRTPAGDVEVRLAVHGEHHVGNALSAVAVAVECGMAPARAAELLGSAVASSRSRMDVRERADGVVVVNDAYNANPDSVRAALKALAAMGRPQSRGPEDDGPRTWAVLGEMLELGDQSVTEHDALGRLAVRLDISRLVAVGEGARPIHQGASHEGSWGRESAWVPDAPAALEMVRAQVRPGDVVLVKASRSIGLDVLAEALLADAPAGTSAGPTDVTQGEGAAC